MIRRAAVIAGMCAVAIASLSSSASAAPPTPAQAVAFLLQTPEAAPTAAAESQPSRWDGGLASGTLRALFGFYRRVLSPQDSATCAFQPTCSRYAERAIARHGLLRGVLMGADRLLRDHAFAVGHYPVDLDTGRLVDPPDPELRGAP